MLYPQAWLHSPGSLFKQIATGMKLFGHMRKINLGGWPHDKPTQQLNVYQNHGGRASRKGETEDKTEAACKSPYFIFPMAREFWQQWSVVLTTQIPFFPYDRKDSAKNLAPLQGNTLKSHLFPPFIHTLFQDQIYENRWLSSEEKKCLQGLLQLSRSTKEWQLQQPSKPMPVLHFIVTSNFYLNKLL